MRLQEGRAEVWGQTQPRLSFLLTLRAGPSWALFTLRWTASSAGVPLLASGEGTTEARCARELTG